MGICVSCRRRDRKAPEKSAGGAKLPAKGAAAELLPRRASVDRAMANSISNIKMTNPIKGMVSKRRKRYIKDGFNLDLAYITDRVIAMGFPAANLEGVYRNHIDEVFRFLEQMHKDRYKIYNLCAERSYDSSRFHERVERYAFEDHSPPEMSLIKPFCENVHSWLSADPRNVAAVHCKAGKGRTGTMVCCYLLYSGQQKTADDALKFYAAKRTHNGKGVTIPSQRRYVEYYAAMVHKGLDYNATKVHIRELVMTPPPPLNGGQCSLELTVSQAQPPLKTPADCYEVRRSDASVRVSLTQCTPLCGDVRVDVYLKPRMMMRAREKLFHFWFNSYFVTQCVGAARVQPPADSVNLETYKLTLNKWQLDDAHKDEKHKLCSADFKVELIIQKQPETSTFRGQGLRTPSPHSSSDSSCSEPDTEPDAHWDSGEPSCRVPYTLLDSQTRQDQVLAPTQQCTNKPSRPPISKQLRDPTKFDAPRINYEYPTKFDATRRPEYTESPPTNSKINIDDQMREATLPYNARLRDNQASPETSDPNYMLCLNSKHSNDTHFSTDTRLGSNGRYIPLTLDEHFGQTSQAPDPSPHYMLPMSVGSQTRSSTSSSEDYSYMRFNETRMSLSDDTRPLDPSYETRPRYLRLSDPTDKSIKIDDDNYLHTEARHLFEESKPKDSCSDHIIPKTNDSKKKHAKRDDEKANDKGKIPKVSSDHTISDDTKKKYTFFHRKDEVRLSKPRLSLGDVRASWREFSGKFGADNRKKKDRDDSS